MSKKSIYLNCFILNIGILLDQNLSYAQSIKQSVLPISSGVPIPIIRQAPVPVHYNEWKDFLVQNVCLDAKRSVISDDPGKPSSSCKEQRNLLPGEPLPYRRTDGVFNPNLPGNFQADAQNGIYFQLWDSLDIGNDVFVTTMNHGRTPSIKNTGLNFNPWGLNVFKLDSSVINNRQWVSIIATRDGSQNKDSNMGAVQYFLSKDCKKDRSWLLFPRDLKELQVQASSISEVWKVGYSPDTTNPESCRPDLTISGAHYAQRFKTGITYTSGKQLDTIITYHQAYDPSSKTKAYEYLYFTKEYGVTRWEAWTNKEGSIPTSSSSRYGGCNGPDTVSGSDLIRVGCRDLSAIFLIPKLADRPHPQSLYSLNDFLTGKKNLINNPDFMSGFIDGQRNNGFGNWSRVDSSIQKSSANVLDWAITKDSFNFKWLSFSCRSKCNHFDEVSGSSVPLGLYVDGNISDVIVGQDLSIGATFKMFKKAPSAPVIISISQYDKDGSMIKESVVYKKIIVSNTDRKEKQLTYLRTNVKKANGASRIRMVVMPQLPNQSYQMTMPYISN